MANYFIEEVFYGEGEGGLACGPVCGPSVSEVKVKTDAGESFYLSLADIEGIFQFFKTDVSTFEMQLTMSDEFLKYTDCCADGGDHMEFFEEKKEDLDWFKLCRYLIYLVRENSRTADQYVKETKGKWLDEIDVPMSDIEEEFLMEYLEEYEDEEDEDEMTGNLFKMMNFMPGATPEELEEKAVMHATRIIEALDDVNGMNDLVKIGILCCGIRIAVYADEEINEKEKTMITGFFEQICGDYPLEVFLQIIENPIDDSAYKIVKDMFDLSTVLGMEFCNMIMCFAYVDGVFEDEVSQNLSNLVSGCTNVFPGTFEDFLDSMDEE